MQVGRQSRVKQRMWVDSHFLRSLRMPQLTRDTGPLERGGGSADFWDCQ